MKTYLEYKDDKSQKFWEIEVKGNTHTVRYGKIGTDGRSTTKKFDTKEKALKDVEKLVKAKKQKGYAEMGAKIPEKLINKTQNPKTETIAEPSKGLEQVNTQKDSDKDDLDDEEEDETPPPNLPANAKRHFNFEQIWCVGEWGEIYETGLWQYYFEDGYLFREVLFDEGKRIKESYFPPEGVPKEAIWVQDIQKINGIYYENCWLVETKKFLQQFRSIYIDCYTSKGEKFRTLKVDKDYKIIADVYCRVSDVPKESIWNSEYGEWQFGEKDEKGRKIAKWKSWDKFGSVVFEAEFTPKGKPISKTVYQEEERPNEYYFYDKQGDLIRTEYYRKGKRSNWYYPFSEGALAERAFKIVEIDDKLSYFDKNDEPIKRKRKRVAWKKYLKAVDGETAIQAYKRYVKLLDTLKKEHAENEDEQDIIENYKPQVKRKFTKAEVKEIEKKIKFPLPPSYVAFLTNIGAFEFERGSSNESSMFTFDNNFDIMSFKKRLEYEWDYDIEKVLNEHEQQIINNVLPFSYGDEGMQSVYFYCFNYNTRNEKTGEVEVYDLNQDDIYRLHHELSCTPTQKASFDELIQKIIQNEIEYFMENMELEL